MTFLAFFGAMYLFDCFHNNRGPTLASPVSRDPRDTPESRQRLMEASRRPRRLVVSRGVFNDGVTVQW